MPHTENHKDSKLDFVYDLQKEIPRWVTHGLIDSEQSKNILEYYKVTADTLKTGRFKPPQKQECPLMVAIRYSGYSLFCWNIRTIFPIMDN